MNFGIIRTAACTPTIRVADCAHNAKKITQQIQQCAEAGVHLAVFPELCITGYTCGDLFNQNRLLDDAENALFQIKKSTQDYSTVAIVGLPFRYQAKLYNCGAVIHRGSILGIVPKTAIPNYGEFYEKRYFRSAPTENTECILENEIISFGTNLIFQCSEMPLFSFAVEICEDLWTPAPPSIRHASSGALIIANLSASDEIVGKAEYRRELVKSHSARIIAGYLYADAGEGESTTDLVYAGHNLISQNGVICAENPPFGKQGCIADIDAEELSIERRRINTYPQENSNTHRLCRFDEKIQLQSFSKKINRFPFLPSESTDLATRCNQILTIQAAGLQKRLTHTGAKTVLIGISGGLDSTLALIVCAKAMTELKRPMTDIVGVTMPCFGTTKRTKNNATRLCEVLGITFKEIDISQSVLQHFQALGHDMNNHDVLYENAQARERTQVLMDLSHQTSGFVVGTGDLSELALGWATYNGDHMSMYSVNSSIPKTLVRHLVREYALQSADLALRAVLLDIVDTPVSPELLPTDHGEMTQITEDIIGPYELHDFFLYYMVRRGFSPEKILWLAEHAFENQYPRETIKKWLTVFLKRFFAQQFKRSCMPDGPKVGSVSLSPRGDWRMPSDAVANSWLKSLDESRE